MSEDLYNVKVGLDGEDGIDKTEPSISKRLKLSPNNSEAVSAESGEDAKSSTSLPMTTIDLEDSNLCIGQTVTSPRTSDSIKSNVSFFNY